MNEQDALQAAEGIAKRVLGLPTLESRNSDGLDFHEIAVWQLKRALVAAYEAGRDAAPAAE